MKNKIDSLKFKIIKIPFHELDKPVQKKHINEIFFRTLLLVFSFILLFFIDKEISLFIVSLAALYLCLSLYSLYMFMANRVYYMDAQFLGIWEGETKLERAKKLWTKHVKKQNVLCFEANGEHYLVNVTKKPPLIVGDTARIYAVPEAIYHGTDGVYRVSATFLIYALIN